MNRQTLDLQQGTPAWLSFRASHFGASEASSMLGLSPYKTRTELLREKKTGITPDVNAATQRIFERGHEIEALARPLAEAVIGEDLFPVTMSYGTLSASCDGLTFDESIAWECKQFNANDFETVKNGELPEKHWPQCQQVMYVTGAENLLFTISDGTNEGTAHVWVKADSELQQRIVNAWDQFEKDLSNFKPEQEVIQAKADPVMALPALSIQVGGAISIQSNLDRFGERLKLFIDETNSKPESDQDFANLEQACKILKDAEDALKRAESDALAQTASVDEMRRTVAYLAEMARTNRLTFEKLVKSEKENRKAKIVTEARNALFDHCQRLQADLPVAFTYAAVNFADAIKGKKTLSSMQDAVNTMLANAKLDADALAQNLREKHVWYIENASEHSFLFSDLTSLIYKSSDDFKAVIENRIAQHKEQERIKAEAAAKAKAESEERSRIEAQSTNQTTEKSDVQTDNPQQKGVFETENPADNTNCLAYEPGSVQKQDVQSINAESDEAQSIQQPVTDGVEINNKSVQEAPSRNALTYAIAVKFDVSVTIAEQWLINAFKAG